MVTFNFGICFSFGDQNFAIITIWFSFAAGELCNLALDRIQIKIVLCYLAWLDDINVIAYVLSVSQTWSAHFRLISNELSLVIAAVNVLWGNWFKKLKLFKVNVLWCFIPNLQEFIRILFKDKFLPSLWAANLKANFILLQTNVVLEWNKTVARDPASTENPCIAVLEEVFESIVERINTLHHETHSIQAVKKEIMILTQALDTDHSIWVRKKKKKLAMKIGPPLLFPLISSFMMEAVEGSGIYFLSGMMFPCLFYSSTSFWCNEWGWAAILLVQS